MNDRDREIVRQVLERLRARIGDERCGIWFEKSAVLSSADALIRVQCRSPFVCELVKRQFRDDLLAAVSDVLPGVGLQFLVDDSPQPSVARGDREASSRQAVEEGPAPESQNESDDARRATEGTIVTKTAPSARHATPRESAATTDGKPRGGRRTYASFATFAVGVSNRLATTMAELAAERPGHASPLLLYGPTGVGKTHLLEAIRTAVKARAPRCMALYLTAEQFTSEFVDALFRKESAALRHKFRRVDLLLLDDIHFLIGKVKTTAELLHTVELLTQNGRQIVLTANGPPRELATLGPELFSRIQGGMVAEIEPPDYATRIEIAAQLARRQNLTVPPEVIEQVASQIGFDARAMAGAIRRLSMTSRATGTPLDLSLAEQTLAQMAQENSRPVRLNDVERAICDVFGVQPNSLRSTRKSPTVSGARAMAMFMARKYTRAALIEIGQHFGRRSHSSVIAASKKIRHWMQQGEAIVVADQSCRIDEAIRRVEEALRRA